MPGIALLSQMLAATNQKSIDTFKIRVTYSSNVPEGIIISDAAKFGAHGVKLVKGLWSGDVPQEDRGYICEVESHHLNMFQPLYVGGSITKVTAEPPIPDNVEHLLRPFA